MGPPQSQHKQLTLYNNESSIYGRRITMALAETKLRHKTFSVPLTGAKPDWFLSSINPKGTLPAVTYGGPNAAPDKPSPESTKIAESHIILEFLADLCPDARLMPPDPAQRARVRAFVDAVDTLFAPACRGWIVDGQSYVTVLNGARAVQRLLPPFPSEPADVNPNPNDGGDDDDDGDEDADGDTDDDGDDNDSDVDTDNDDDDNNVAHSTYPPQYAIGAQFTIADLSVAPFLACLEVACDKQIGNYAPDEAKALGAAMRAPEFARLKAYAARLARRPSYECAIDKDSIERALRDMMHH